MPFTKKEFEEMKANNTKDSLVELVLHKNDLLDEVRQKLTDAREKISQTEDRCGVLSQKLSSARNAHEKDIAAVKSTLSVAKKRVAYLEGRLAEQAANQMVRRGDVIQRDQYGQPLSEPYTF